MWNGFSPLWRADPRLVASELSSPCMPFVNVCESAMSRQELRCERRERECVRAQMQPVAAGCNDAMLNVVSREPNHFFINVKCWTTSKIGQRQRGQFGIDMSDVRDLACRVPIMSSARSRAADLWLISDRLPVAPSRRLSPEVTCMHARVRTQDTVLQPPQSSSMSR